MRLVLGENDVLALLYLVKICGLYRCEYAREASVDMDISTKNLWIWIWMWMGNFISTASLFWEHRPPLKFGRAKNV